MEENLTSTPASDDAQDLRAIIDIKIENYNTVRRKQDIFTRKEFQ